MGANATSPHDATEAAHGPGGLHQEQFIDIIQWTEDSEGTQAWRFPMADMEIQYGASLTVRESQMAVFVNEGKVANVFGLGRYTLTTQTIPVLSYLKNWDKLFESPFKSDVYFFSTRQQLDQKWGTPQPITIRDADFGAVRSRALGNFAYRVADPRAFHTQISGARQRYTVAEFDGQLRGLVLQNISAAIAASGIPFLDLAASQQTFAAALAQQLGPEFQTYGLALESLTVQNLSLPEDLQKVLAQNLTQGLQGGAASAPATPSVTSPVVALRPDEVMATLEKLADLKAKGIFTDDEFNAKKTDLLKKLV